MTIDLSTDTKKGVNGSLLIDVLLIVLGIAGIALPAISTIVAETWIALILISAGSAKLVFAFQTRNTGG
jgi:uncharacterized membrane protein HdeD (DUF308 family)